MSKMVNTTVAVLYKVVDYKGIVLMHDNWNFRNSDCYLTVTKTESVLSFIV